MAIVPPIANLLAFESVARLRSFAHAASERHLTASAISHQISKLENMIGIQLLIRSSHTVRLTSAGEQYLRRISGALSTITTATDDIQRGVNNALYVHASPSFAALWLVPRLGDFSQAHPEIALNLSAATTHSNFDTGEADIDIRYGISQWPDLEVETLFEEKVLPLANPEFLRKNKIRKMEHLLYAPLIQSNVNVVQWSNWFNTYTNLKTPDKFSLRFDRSQMSLDAAAQGLGIALESATIANQHLETGRLVPVFELDKAIVGNGHSIVYPTRNSNRAPVQAFLKWLRKKAKEASTL